MDRFPFAYAHTTPINMDLFRPNKIIDCKDLARAAVPHKNATFDFTFLPKMAL